MRPGVERRSLQVHHEVRARVNRREAADLERIEYAEDVELPLLGEVGCVGEEGEGNLHAVA
jgi:hypothetical protein